MLCSLRNTKLGMFEKPTNCSDLFASLEHYKTLILIRLEGHLLVYCYNVIMLFYLYIELKKSISCTMRDGSSERNFWKTGSRFSSVTLEHCEHYL